MKVRLKLLTTLIALVIFTCVIPGPVSAQRGYVNFQIFYDQLSPYGQWTNNSDYGYIWIPDVGPEFSPYSTNGYWVMTDYGWTWVSDYEWGWAPFHYGRWDYDNYYGWFWVPDNEWGPSWVTWRRGNGYYGWAPMRPGISISMSFGGGYDDMDRWNFVRDRDFGRSNIGRYYVNRRDNDMIIRNSSVINNTYIDNNRNVTYITGPRGDDVQRVTGRRISSVTIRDNDRPGQKLNNNQLQLYRPQVERNNNIGDRPAPSRILDRKDVRPVLERNTNYKRNNVQQQQQQQQKQPESRRQDQQQLQQKQQLQQQQTESRRQDQLQLEQKQQQKQQIDNRRQDQVQQQQQQQSEKKRQDQVQLKQQQQQQPQQQPQPQQQQQAETRKQDQQQKTLQQNDQRKQEVNTNVRSKRIERQKNKANPPDKKTKKSDKSNETSGNNKDKID